MPHFHRLKVPTHANTRARHRGRTAKSAFAEETDTRLNCQFQISLESLWCCPPICQLESNKRANSLCTTEKLLKDRTATRMGTLSSFRQSICPQVLCWAECQATRKVPAEAIFWSEYTFLLTVEERNKYQMASLWNWITSAEWRYPRLCNAQ